MALARVRGAIAKESWRQGVVEGPLVLVLVLVAGGGWRLLQRSRA